MPDASRFWWLDVLKGVSILWVVFFHAYSSQNTHYPWVLDPGFVGTFMQRCRPESWLDTVGCDLTALFIGVMGLGFHAVGVFLVASGFGLTYAQQPDGSQQSWLQWYGRRLVRLFPMYWLAHLVYLVSPLVARDEPLDYRFLLSFIGDRVYPADWIFFYANPAWWYFGLLLQLYLVFPLLFMLLRRAGVARFLLFTGAFTLASRAVLLGGFPVSGHALEGAFFGARLWEFALGMALGSVARTRWQDLDKALFSRWTLAAGAVLYGLALWSYRGTWSYAFTDALVGSGLFILLAHLARGMGRVPRVAGLLAYVGTYSYGLYLLHQPYVIWLGEHSQQLGLWTYTSLAVVAVTVLTVGSIALERGVNLLTRGCKLRKTGNTNLREGIT